MKGVNVAEIELRKVVKKYGELTAVNDLTFKEEDGELLVLLGSPGAEKFHIKNDC